MAGLREGQALVCSTYLVLGLAVPAPHSWVPEPPCATWVLSTKYNMSDRIVSDIQCRAEGETFYIRYNTGVNIVLCL